MSTCRPEAIAGQPRSCAGVGRVERPLEPAADVRAEGRERAHSSSVPTRGVGVPAAVSRSPYSCGAPRAHHPLPSLTRKSRAWVARTVPRASRSVPRASRVARLQSSPWRPRAPPTCTSRATTRPTASSPKEPLALLVGFVLDQQVTVQKAFSGPLEIRRRLGSFDATTIAAADPGELEELFRQQPAIHRFPGNMARRVQELCAAVAEDYGGRAERVWLEAESGEDLERRLLALPGIGPMKSDARSSRSSASASASGRPAGRTSPPRTRRWATSTPTRRSRTTRRRSARTRRRSARPSPPSRRRPAARRAPRAPSRARSRSAGSPASPRRSG